MLFPKISEVLISKDRGKDLILIILVFSLFSLILYGYFWFFSPYKLQLLYQNWDGPAYVVIAKSFYNLQDIEKANNLRLPSTYFAAHLPLYPLFIRIFSFIGYYRSMVFISQLFSLLFILTIYYLIRFLYPKTNALLISLSLIFFPPRWFTVSHVGSSEPVFLFFLSLSIFLFLGERYKISALMAAIAQMARVQGILFFFGLLFYYLYAVFIKRTKSIKKAIFEFVPFFLIPLVFISICFLYQIRYQDFFALFHSLGYYHHLQWPPFKVFFDQATRYSPDIWQEDIIFNYLLYLGVVFSLFKEKSLFLAFTSLVYFSPLPFLVHIDVARYSLSLLPFLAIAYRKYLSRKTLFTMIFLISPAILVYSINFMKYNLSP